MNAHDFLMNRLQTGMIKGQMHVCLRDVGRLAGGYASSNSLTMRELLELEDYAVNLSVNDKEGRDKWLEGVAFGRRQPVEWQAQPQRESRSLDWNDEIGRNIREDSLKVIDHQWLEIEEISEPDSWNPKDELTQYIQALYDHDEHVAYVTEAWDKDGRLVPTKGVWDRTAGQLIEELNRYGSIEEVVGDPRPAAAGAWIRFNPMDGNGCKDENVTSWRHALVESDTVEVERQIAILKKLELPITTLVHSGGKSVHATVKIDADTIEEYRKRVNFLYEVCEKNGLPIDSANRNPSRLSRMPGIMRGEKRQRLLATHIGKGSWKEWESHIHDLNDDLPDIEQMSESALDPKNLPDKADVLIEGILREGHKMRLAGPSKAGKSFALIQLAVAIAEGKEWLGWQCKQGNVLYVNLELDRASCYHRIADVYAAKGWRAENAARLHVWNLRGKSMPMDKLAPRLIRRARDSHYKAVIIDPIYKVLTGDENSADEMSHFCNQFDKLCDELKCAVIDCHHHSKGGQGQKSSRDRASGSGVFARDPDALLDLIELNASGAIGVRAENTVCSAMIKFLDVACPGWHNHVSMDDALVPDKLRQAIAPKLSRDNEAKLLNVMTSTREIAHRTTAWRVEGTLREFAGFKAKNLFFEYPVHVADENSLLADAKADGEEPPWKEKRKASATDEKVDRKNAFVAAVTALSEDGQAPTQEEVMEYLGIGRSSFFNRQKEAGFMTNKEKKVVKRDD